MQKYEDITNYVRTQRARFDEAPLTPVDLLALCSLAYQHLEIRSDLFEDSGSAPIGILLDRMPAAAYSEGVFASEEMAKLLMALVDSPRFGPLRIEDFVCEVDEGRLLQFAAFCVEVPMTDERSLFCVVYRGTDPTLVGWHEDLNLAIMPTVPAEDEALAYLEKTARRHPESQFILTGHSKGGALAEHAALRACPETAARIEGVYSFDGPGLWCMGSSACPELIEHDRQLREDYASCGIPIVKYVFPAMVGLMMEKRPLANLVVLESSGYGMGHEVMSVRIVEGRFIEGHLGERERAAGTLLTRWVDRLSLAERRCVVETIFDGHIVSDREFRLLGVADLIALLPVLSRGYRRLRGEDRRLMRHSMKVLCSILAGREE